MANSYTLTLQIAGKVASSLTQAASNASKSLQGIQKSAESTSKSMELVKNAMGLAAGYFSLEGIVDFCKDAMNASNEAATATQRLQTTMSNVKGTTQAQIASVAAYTDALQQNTTISHVANETGASQLATFGMSAAAIKQLLPALDNMAVAQNGVNVTSSQMQQTATQLGRAVAGNTGMLSRYGIVLTTAQQKLFKQGNQAKNTAMLVQLLKQKYGDMANAMAKTPAGRIEQLKNAWEDVKEEIGAKLTPVVITAFTVLDRNLPKIQSGLMGIVNAITPAFTFAQTTLIPALGTSFKVAGGVLSWFGDHAKTLGPIILGVAAAVGVYRAVTLAMVAAQKAGMVITALSDAWKTASVFIQLLSEGEKLAAVAQLALNMAMEANPIGVITVAIIALVAAGVLLYKNWGKISAEGKKLGSDIENIFNNIRSYVDSVVADAENWGKNLIDNFIGGITGNIAKVEKAVKNVASTIKNFLGFHSPAKEGPGADADQWMPNLMQMLSGGIVGNVSLMQKAATKAIHPLQNAMTSLGVTGSRATLGITGQPNSSLGGMPQLGSAGEGMNITYAPVYNITGASAQDVKQAAGDAQRRFSQQMETWLRNKKRTAFVQ